MPGISKNTIAGAFIFALSAGRILGAEWYFETAWGTYRLTSPTDGSVRVTADGFFTPPTTYLTNTTAFTHGHKLITFPPDGQGNYTAALIYDKCETSAGHYHGAGAAIYQEKQKNDINWGPGQDIGSVFDQFGPKKALNGYLAVAGPAAGGNVYLVVTDKTSSRAYVAKKQGPGPWTGNEPLEQALERLYNSGLYPDMSGHSLTCAYGAGDTLGISTTRNDYPGGRVFSSWVNVKRGASWETQPYLAHGLEFQARLRYGSSCTVDEDGTLYVCYELYNPEHPAGVNWKVPALPPQPGGTGVMVIPADRGQTKILAKGGGYPIGVGNHQLTSCAPYIDAQSNPPARYWHIGYGHSASGPQYGLHHIWERVDVPVQSGAWTGKKNLRNLTGYDFYGWPNVATYYDAANGYFYVVMVYEVYDSRPYPELPHGRIYLDVIKFNPAAANPDEVDQLIFYPSERRGFEVAPLTKTHARFPQVTVDKGNDGEFDILVAWTEADNLIRSSDGPWMPADGDVFYRQFTLTYLGP